MPKSQFRIPRAFTLTELLIVIAIIGIITGLGLSAFAGAVELAREQRTRSIIAKIDQLIMERYESYRTRAVPIRALNRQAAIASANAPIAGARNRLYGMRELMRLELPDRISDLCSSGELTDINADNDLDAVVLTNSPVMATLTSVPSLARSYRRQVAKSISINGSAWSMANESSECLYLILSTMHDGDKNALDFFTSDEIGDTDEDGMKEILDAWGRPIQFIRWPAGYAEQPGNDGAWGVVSVDDDGDGTNDNLSEAGWPGSDDIVPITKQTRNYVKAPDPFDPVKVDPRWGFASVAPQPYAIYPLIFSGGRDKVYDIDVGNVVYSQTTRAAAGPQPAVPPNDPYYADNPAGSLAIIGTAKDTNGDGYLGYADNITNHNLNPP